MKFRFFKTLWGHTGPLSVAAGQARAGGFDGLEGPVPLDPVARAEWSRVLEETGLAFIAEISTTGYAVPDAGSTPGQHLDAMEACIERSLPLRPEFFSAMAGSDLWEFRDSVKFFTAAHELAGRYGVRVGFETHRSRSLFHPLVAKNLLAELPPIELTLDFSHWCNVCERLVMDELPDVLELCAQRALHIQPRVGYDQGAQVPDPRAGLYASAVNAHLRWWQVIVDGMRKRGFPAVTFTPEFGPDGYQQIDVATGLPCGDLWEMNQWIAAKIRETLK